MKNKLTLGLVALSLGGCALFDKPPLPPTKTEYRVIYPDAEYFRCEQIKLPDPDDLTNVEVAKLINELVKSNKICDNNMKAIKKFLEEADKKLKAEK